MLRIREDAIVNAVNRLLVTKGYELMTVDEVAAEAGLAKASLYKHFTSKEELAAAAMIRVLDRAIAHIDSLHRHAPELAGVAQLEAVVRWTLSVQLAGEMREELINVVGLRAAHFASNLGVVELCLALHLTFDFREDRLIWDTGHQIRRSLRKSNVR